MWGLPMVSYHPDKLHSHRYCESADISVLNLSRDHVIKSSSDFEGRIPILQITALPGLVAIGTAKGQI